MNKKYSTNQAGTKNSATYSPSLQGQVDGNAFKPFIPIQYEQANQYQNFDNYEIQSKPRGYDYVSDHRPTYHNAAYYFEAVVPPSPSPVTFHQNNKNNHYVNPPRNVNPHYESSTRAPLTYYINNAKSIYPHVEISPPAPNKTILPIVAPKRAQVTKAYSAPYDIVPQQETVGTSYDNNPEIYSASSKEEDYNYEENNNYEPDAIKYSRNKYEDTPNPFADPNFDFDVFLNNFRQSSQRDNNKHTSSHRTNGATKQSTYHNAQPPRTKLPTSRTTLELQNNNKRPSTEHEIYNQRTKLNYAYVSTPKYADPYVETQPATEHSHRFKQENYKSVPQTYNILTTTPKIAYGRSKPTHSTSAKPRSNIHAQIETQNPKYQFKTTENFSELEPEMYSRRLKTTSPNTTYTYFQQPAIPSFQISTGTRPPTKQPEIHYNQKEISPKTKYSSQINNSDEKLPPSTASIEDEYYYDDYEYEEGVTPNPYNNNKESPYILPNETPEKVIKQAKYSAKYQETLPKSRPKPVLATTASNFENYPVSIEASTRSNIIRTSTTSRPIYTIRQRARTTVKSTTTPRANRIVLRQRHKDDDVRPDDYSDR